MTTLTGIRVAQARARTDFERWFRAHRIAGRIRNADRASAPARAWQLECRLMRDRAGRRVRQLAAMKREVMSHEAH